MLTDTTWYVFVLQHAGALEAAWSEGAGDWVGEFEGWRDGRAAMVSEPCW
jgi:hypothetical protein